MALWPAVRRRLAGRLSRRRRVLLGLLMLSALLAPDLDVVLGLATGKGLAAYHNGPSHSLLCALIFAIPFACVCRLVTGRRLLFFALVGAIAYTGHVLLDAMTWGPGVQMFWPITAQRYSTAPFVLFRGVRHSVGAPIWQHLLTIGNDLTFALAVWLIGRYVRRKRPG